MLYPKQTFLQILLIEFTDLECDIEELIERYNDDHAHEKISNYVLYENCALLSNELDGIRKFYRELLTVNADNYQTLESMQADLSRLFQEQCHEFGLAQSLYGLVVRKMNKVYRYITATRTVSAGCYHQAAMTFSGVAEETTSNSAG